MIPARQSFDAPQLWIENLNQTYAQLATPELLRLLLASFGSELAFANSFGLEDVVLQHLLLDQELQPYTFVLDTGRLPSETYDLIETWRIRYGVRIHLLNPHAPTLEAFVLEHGPNAFYQSQELRKQCCAIRKLEPLGRALHGRAAWLTGLRRAQSQTRQTLDVFALDEQGRLKISPLAAWSLDELWTYIRKHHVPYNVLHDRGYPSLGCAPCTRAITSGEDLRAGRWWWELDAQRECGLHVASKEVRNHAD